MATSVLGLASSVAQIGLTSIIVKPTRKVGPFTAQVTLRETHSDELVITNHPVEQGALISDHAYKAPASLNLQIGWSNSPSVSGFASGLIQGIGATLSGVQSLLTGNSADQVRDIYEKLLKLQTERIPFSVFTGKRVYTNMLLSSLQTTTDKETENSLLITAELKQVIIVSTRTVIVSAPAANQADPSATMPITNNGQQNLQPGSAYIPYPPPV